MWKQIHEDYVGWYGTSRRECAFTGREKVLSFSLGKWRDAQTKVLSFRLGKWKRGIS